MSQLSARRALAQGWSVSALDIIRAGLATGVAAAPLVAGADVETGASGGGRLTYSNTTSRLL
jgi:hypothetical protein